MNTAMTRGACSPTFKLAPPPAKTVVGSRKWRREVLRTIRSLVRFLTLCHTDPERLPWYIGDHWNWKDAATSFLRDYSCCSKRATERFFYRAEEMVELELTERELMTFYKLSSRLP